MSVTSATTTEDLEEVMLNHVIRAAYDTFTPSKPTVFFFDDVGNLSVSEKYHFIRRAKILLLLR